MKIQKPKALKPGDTIGLIGPSGSTNDTQRLPDSVKALENLGFRVKVGKSCTEKYGYLSAPDALRAADVNAFFEDTEIDGILCFKGGYGTPRILDMLDYACIAENPKVFIGYSDITALHLAFLRHAKLVTFHGLMGFSLTGSADTFSLNSWKQCFMSKAPLGVLETPPLSSDAHDASALDMGTLYPGKAKGILCGGNLALVAALTGTDFALEPEGKIIFLEDVGEEPYRIDRMLTQLRLAGVFEKCAGVILGTWSGCTAEDPGRALTLEQIFQDIVAPAKKPCVTNFQAGHCMPMHTLAFGLEVQVDADKCIIEYAESATI